MGTRDRSMVTTPESSYTASRLWTDGNQQDGTTGTVTYSDTYSKPYGHKVMTDVVTPNFRRRIANGEIINSYCSSSTVQFRPSQPTSYNRSMKWTSSKGYSYSTEIGQRCWASSRQRALLSWDTVNRDALRQACIDEAVQQAYANVDVSEMLALATLAEGRKTVDFLRDTLYRVYKIAKAVRRLNYKGVIDQLSPKELAERYMELRYAVRPLIYDVNGLVAALDESRSHDRMTARGFASRSAQYSDVIPNVEVAWTLWSDITRTLSYNVSVRAGVLSSVNVNRAQVFGIDQLAETAWELLPFSFIVDWFINVGQALAAATPPTAGVKQLASWASVEENLTVDNRMGTVTSTYGTDLDDSISWSGSHGHTQQWRERIIDPTLNVWPTVDVSLDMFKITDLGLILKQVFK